MKIKIPNIKFPEKLEPYKGVILFAVILMAANFFWKYNVLGDEDEGLNSLVTFWGIDITAPFVWMAKHVAFVTEFILRTIGFDIILKPDNVLGYSNGNGVQIIWACTGLKQSYIFLCIIAFNRGSWKKKIWYIPLGLLVVYTFNIFRIAFIAACMENHPDWFEFLHLYAFKYLFYGIIFLMWVLWEEKIIGMHNEPTISENQNQ
ncbi:MAG: exosortase/archaeosortase family protein [Paludibacter sp.]|nr:exosortase/archaeosortase family protein [Paludibacter sp.]